MITTRFSTLTKEIRKRKLYFFVPNVDSDLIYKCPTYGNNVLHKHCAAYGNCSLCVEKLDAIPL